MDDLRKSKIHKIYQNNLCIGCGLCESIVGTENIEMSLNSKGFFYPKVKHVIEEGENIIQSVCPGLNIVNDIKFEKNESIWGKVLESYSGYSNDEVVRKKGSSGGVASAIAIYLIETKQVDCVLQVGGDKDDYTRNTLKYSRNRNDVINAASSRYAPALVFDKIGKILTSTSETFCFIGKPCDISALKNYVHVYPEFKNRFKVYISIMCAGIPSFEGTQEVLNNFNHQPPVKNVVYRGNGWPGNFSFNDNSGEEFQMSYNESWGNNLNRYLNFRCKICPDGIGLQADIVVGDAWETNDGYPDFTERDGQSIILARTEEGSNILKNMKDEKQLSTQKLDLDIIAKMQPYQYYRRTRVASRIFAVHLLKSVRLNFKNTRIYLNLLHSSIISILREFLGTVRRLLFVN